MAETMATSQRPVPLPDPVRPDASRAHSIFFRHAAVRAGTALLPGLAAYVAAREHVRPAAAGLIGMDVGSAVLLALLWGAIATANAHTTRARAGAEDPGRTLVYVIVVLASATSLLAATILVGSARDLTPALRQLGAILCLATVALAWAVTHTAFTFRYAHLYYREDAEGVGGIDLPGSADPAYFDFAYFAFTIGMCFQVSDACVSSAQIRRTVLLHAVISFAYNSIILAFVLNLVFGLAN
jgi:uncharacterized membrane protein